MAQLFANNAFASLGSSLSSVSTSLVLATGTGSRFPTPTGGDHFLLTLVGIDSNGNENAWEVVRVTTRSADTLTVVRAQEGTTATLWASGTRVELRLTAATISSKADSSDVAASLSGKASLSGASFTGPITHASATTIADWNAISQTGWYMAAGAENAPTPSVWYIGYSVTHNNDWITQEIWRFSDNDDSNLYTYRREKNGGTWGSWVRVYKTLQEITSLAMPISGGVFTGPVNVAGSFEIFGTDPVLNFNDTNAGANLKRSRLYSNSGVIALEVLDDAYTSVLRTPLRITAWDGETTLTTAGGTNTLKIVSSGAEYLGLATKLADASGSVKRTAYHDIRNENEQPVASHFFHAYPDGSSEYNLLLTAPGARTSDRRNTALIVDGFGNLYVGYAGSGERSFTLGDSSTPGYFYGNVNDVGFYSVNGTQISIDKRPGANSNISLKAANALWGVVNGTNMWCASSAGLSVGPGANGAVTALDVFPTGGGGMEGGEVKIRGGSSATLDWNMDQYGDTLRWFRTNKGTMSAFSQATSLYFDGGAFSFDVLGKFRATNGDGSMGVIAHGTGGIDIWRSDGVAHVDFKTSEAEDFDCRIIQNGNGLLFQVGGSGSAYTAFNLQPGFTELSGARTRSSVQSADHAWTSAQFEAYASPGSAADFARTTYHVQDYSQAYQLGYRADTARLGWFSADGTEIATCATSGGEFIIGQLVGGSPAGMRIGKNRSADGYAHIDLVSQTGIDYSARISRDSGANGNLVIWNGGGGVVALQTSSQTAWYVDSAGNMAMSRGSFREKAQAVGASNIDCSTGNVFTKTIGGATTFTVSNVPASGESVSFILDLTNGGSATVTWWANVKWANGAAPALTASGRDVLGFFTHNGGATWTGLMLGKDVK